MTQCEALELFEYNDGILYWKKKAWKTGPDLTGCIAGAINGNGYSHVMINGKIMLQHRIVFLIHKGYIPKYIDHVDRNRLNNKIENLREVTARQNQANRSLGKNNSSGYLGVSFEKQTKKFAATSRLNGKKINLGRYSTAKQASEVYNNWAIKTFKEFAHV